MNLKYNIYMLLAATVCLAIGACSGDDNNSKPEVPADPDALCTITPHEIAISPVDASQTPITRSATGEPEQKATYAENLGVNYSAEATLEAVPPDAQTRAGANLATGAQYRIVVFNGAGEIVGDVVYKQGSTAVVKGKELKLKAGTYRLFAYTFNSTSDIRELDADKQNVTVNSGEDFMTYTEASYTVLSTDYSSGKALNISFVRQCVRLKVRIIAEAYTDYLITAANLTIGNVFGSGSKWNAITNTDETSILPSVAGTASLVKATDNGPAVDCGSSADNKYLITSPCTSQTISVSGLNVTIGGVTKTPAGFNFSNPITLAKGGNYRLIIYVGNYYLLTRSNPVMIGGMKWARTNLQQTGSGNSVLASFVDNPWDTGSYWNWGIRDATVYNNHDNSYSEWNESVAGYYQSPCCSLGSGWRLPTDSEQATLVNNYIVPKGTKVKINGTINTIGDYGWATDAKGVVFKDGNQIVFLPAASYRNTSGIVSPYDSGGGYYWSTTPDYIDDEAIALCFYNSSKVGIEFAKRRTGNSLRCVQDQL